jgi:hypothetical protein
LSKGLLTISNSLYFNDYRLHINNPLIINPDSINLNDLVGSAVIDALEEIDSATLFFENNQSIWIDLRDEAYYDPEATVLHGPEIFCMVW